MRSAAAGECRRRQDADAGGVAHQRLLHQVRLQVIHLVDQVADGVLRRQVEVDLGVAVEQLAVHQDHGPVVHLAQGDGEVGGEHGAADAALEAEEGDHVAEGAGRLGAVGAGRQVVGRLHQAGGGEVQRQEGARAQEQGAADQVRLFRVRQHGDGHVRQALAQVAHRRQGVAREEPGVEQDQVERALGAEGVGVLGVAAALQQVVAGGGRQPGGHAPVERLVLRQDYDLLGARSVRQVICLGSLTGRV